MEKRETVLSHRSTSDKRIFIDKKTPWTTSNDENSGMQRKLKNIPDTKNRSLFYNNNNLSSRDSATRSGRGISMLQDRGDFLLHISFFLIADRISCLLLSPTLHYPLLSARASYCDIDIVGAEGFPNLLAEVAWNVFIKLKIPAFFVPNIAGQPQYKTINNFALIWFVSAIVCWEIYKTNKTKFRIMWNKPSRSLMSSLCSFVASSINVRTPS